MRAPDARLRARVTQHVRLQSIHEDVDIWVSVHSDGAQLRELVPLVEQGRLTRYCGGSQP